MQKFLQQFIHYMCSRCIISIPHHTVQDKTGGRHSHNGEILDLLQPVAPSSDRILSAYRVWQTHAIPRNMQSQLAQAYNCADRVIPATPKERAVKLILDNWSDIWIRHGEEQPGVLAPKAVFPDPDSRWTTGHMVNNHRDQNWFAVDLDSNPFSAFHEHRIELTSGYPWTYTVGLLPYSTFRQANGELQHPQDRDHLYARCNIPARHWVFLYRDFDQYTVDLQQQQAQREVLLNSGIASLHIDEYQSLVQLYKHLTHYTGVSYSRVAEPRKKPNSRLR
jgi:hypothetical protein